MSEVKMYLAVGRPCPRSLLFDLPHKRDPMTAKAIMKRYPEFAATFDGASSENTLLFYYKKDKTTGVYSFIDEEAELEVAELLGVKVKTFIDELSDDDDAAPPPLNTEQVQSFKEHLADIKTGIDWINSSASK